MSYKVKHIVKDPMGQCKVFTQIFQTIIVLKGVGPKEICLRSNELLKDECQNIPQTSPWRQKNE